MRTEVRTILVESLILRVTPHPGSVARCVLLILCAWCPTKKSMQPTAKSAHGSDASAAPGSRLGCNGAGQLFFASVQSSACVTFFLSALLHENPVQQNSFMFKACLQVNLEVPVPQLVAVLTADILQFA